MACTQYPYTSLRKRYSWVGMYPGISPYFPSPYGVSNGGSFLTLFSALLYSVWQGGDVSRYVPFPPPTGRVCFPPPFGIPCCPHHFPVTFFPPDVTCVNCFYQCWGWGAVLAQFPRHRHVIQLWFALPQLQRMFFQVDNGPHFQQESTAGHSNVPGAVACASGAVPPSLSPF